MLGQPKPKVEEFTLLFDKLLNHPRKAKWQYLPKKNNPEQKFTYGFVRDIGILALQSHLQGVSTKAIVVCTGGFAHFICWDMDSRFRSILGPRVVSALRKRNWQRGAFATTGSDNERGKIVLTFKPRIPEAVARRIAEEVQDEVLTELSSAPSLFPLEQAQFSAFPSRKSGREVRLLGRNRIRNGPLEQALDLDFKPSDLKYVRPVFIPYDPADAATAQRAEWASRLIEAQFYGTAKDAWNALLRLADEALRLSEDPVAAMGLLRTWAAELAGKSVRPSTVTQFKRDDAIKRAIEWVQMNRRQQGAPKVTKWAPIDLTSIPTPKGAARIYEALAQYVTTFDLNAHCFAMDYERLAAMSGYRDGGRASKNALVAEDAGLLFRLHRGCRRKPGVRGEATLWCLRGQGESLQDAYDDGVEQPMFVERVETVGSPIVTLVDGKKVGLATVLPIAA